MHDLGAYKYYKSYKIPVTSVTDLLIKKVNRTVIDISCSYYNEPMSFYTLATIKDATHAHKR